MAKFTIGMDWDGFEDEARKEFEKELSGQLRDAGISGIKVHLRKQRGSNWECALLGTEDAVEKAKKILA